ncbi:MAG: carboxypeptidase-like regulatory domain-containing protein [Vicinamibacterales bacterium]
MERTFWSFGRALVALTLTVGFSIPGSAQVTTGSVTGSVRDGQSGVIPGATVIAISDTKGTKTTAVVTNSSGDFVIPNIAADTYSVEVKMDGFKTLHRSGVVVGAGNRVAIGLMTIQVGGLNETVRVTADAPMIQAQSGERSFTIDTSSVANLPIASRGFTELAALAPGVGPQNGKFIDRLGDKTVTDSDTNIIMDGVSTLDTGSNRAAVNINTESIAEVKVLVSNYQAEYGRSSGLQITSVTKSGTNRLHGSFYDVEHNSDWGPNSQTNILNGAVKAVAKNREWGYSLGGPIGKPGANNKLFFFYSHEFEPRKGGGTEANYRMPTALERAGDFSKSTDNRGALYPYVKDPSKSGTCSATSQVACFADGGVLGKIPSSSLYQLGLNILNMYPLPNIDNVPAGQTYNFSSIKPVGSILAWQPVVRIDYQPTQKLRGSVKWAGVHQRSNLQYGTIPGYNDTKPAREQVTLISTSVNYTLSSTLFLEGTWGTSISMQNPCEGFGGGGGGPQFCNGYPQNPNSNKNNVGLGSFPFVYPNGAVIDSRYQSYRAANAGSSPAWDGTTVLLPPSFSYGSRIANAPPQPGFSTGNAAKNEDTVISLTKVAGKHTYKSGFYWTHSLKNQSGGASLPSVSFGDDTVGTNPCDTSFGFANAATGCFSSYTQNSKAVEGNYLYDNVEAYVQDNWRLSPKLTLDYGVRLVHATPQYDSRGQAANFFPDKFDLASAPVLYVAACASGKYPCINTADRQAKNPITGQILGPNTVLAIGTLVPNQGVQNQGLIQAGNGIAKTTFVWPALGVAPRFGMAYDLSGKQTFVLRGGGGLYFDRPSGDTIFPQTNNPLSRDTTTIRYSTLQNFGTGGGLSTKSPASLSVYQYDSPLPSSTQWNGGMQMALPWATVVDVSYVGQHGYNIPNSTSLNTIDLGTAFLPQYQDLTKAATTPGATSVDANNMRLFRGYAGISVRTPSAWITSHQLHVSFTRRFKNGLSFGFNDVIGLSTKTNQTERLEHVNGSLLPTLRADQAVANKIFQEDPTRHNFKGNFVWDLPDVKSSETMLRVVGLVVNDWQLSGIWTATTGGPYTIGYTYASGGGVGLTGSSDFAARIRLAPGVATGAGGHNGCNEGDIYHQFNTAAFLGPLAVVSTGLESGTNYLKDCFGQTLDLSIARSIRLPKGRTIQLRVDMFNAPNLHGITGRNRTLQLQTPADPVTNIAPLYDPITGLLNNGVNLLSTGAVSPNRSQPKNAGFGMANAYQAPRTVQAQIRFSF